MIIFEIRNIESFLNIPKAMLNKYASARQKQIRDQNDHLKSEIGFLTLSNNRLGIPGNREISYKE